MAIVSDLPFVLEFQKDYTTIEPVVIPCALFYDDKAEALSSKVPTVVIQENDPISISFHAEEEARLYLDALDIIPAEFGCELDKDGRIYYAASPERLPLYRLGNDEFDELRVDNFLLEVHVENKIFYGWLQIQPKQLYQNEWEIMVEDLEHVATGLAQDIVQRNIGFGEFSSIAIPPEQLRQFLILQKRAPRLLSALYDIANNPRFAITTNYVRVERTKDVVMDNNSIRQELRKPNQGRFILAPQKSLNYNTQENRYLKKLINFCIKRIEEFSSTIENLLSKDNLITNSPYHSTQYKLIYNRNLNQYYETSKKLIKMMNIISQKEWYQSVSNFSNGRGSHAFALDPCFSFVEKVYRELLDDAFSVQIDPSYSFSWKKSSQLYEVWCFLTICRWFEKHYISNENAIISQSTNRMLFPALTSGKQVVYFSEEVKLVLSYDRIVPGSANECSMYIDPFYYDYSDTDRNIHNRPDIRIDIYYIPEDIYIGSIVVECKYRKIRNFYKNCTYNSKEQLDDYYGESKTQLYFDRLSMSHDIRPVKKVFAVTPDNSPLPRGRRENHIVVRQLRPGNEESEAVLFSAINDIISAQVQTAKEAH